MSKILKARNVKVDSDDLFDIEVPVSNSFVANKSPVKFDGYENFDDITEFDTEDDVVSQLSSENIVDSAEEEARKIISNAKLEAETIISNSKLEIENERINVLENSRKEGYEDGYNSALAEAQSIKDEAQNILYNAKEEREKIIQSIEGDMIELIASISDKIIGKTVKINPQIISVLIKQGLKQNNVVGELFIKVSEYDYEEAYKHKDELLGLVDGTTTIEIIKDSSLSAGDCIIETPFGNVDCSITEQLDGIKQNLYYILENR